MAIAAEELVPAAAGAARTAGSAARDALQVARENEPLRPMGSVRPDRVGPGSRGGQVPSPRRVASFAGAGRAARSVAGAPAGAYRSLPGHGVTRVVFALSAFVLALELGSYLTGTYFTWDLKAPWNRTKTAAKYLGLYPGQLDHLNIPAAAPTTAAQAFPFGPADRASSQSSTAGHPQYGDSQSSAGTRRPGSPF